jgi:hypothetical protein
MVKGTLILWAPYTVPLSVAADADADAVHAAATVLQRQTGLKVMLSDRGRLISYVPEVVFLVPSIYGARERTA